MEETTPGLNGPLSVRDIGIRSYVIRSGRMTDMQKEALAQLYVRYGVSWNPEASVDAMSLFGSDGPFIVEVGFGMGLATAAIAQALPAARFLGLEVHAPGVGKLLSEIASRNIENLRVCRHDAVEVIDAMIRTSSVDGFHIFFPDPWPKKRHHKRRIMSAAFVRLLADKLKPGGYIYYVTDWEEYAVATLDTLRAETALMNNSDAWAERQPWRPITKFEQRAINDGRPIRELYFTKRG
ncbi:MAG TPA: tRNA (guanosine(46)-N7)-methyltransferase TrmB [bacterium]|nr:tRNA (guanosine(46)-N7)-methyltransferase TrmB [bacterium]